jgi:dTDP-alpha-D-glucuronic acid decarboxylase
MPAAGLDVGAIEWVPVRQGTVGCQATLTTLVARAREDCMARAALVTGGSGFIGSHLVDALVAEGWSVRILDVAPPSTGMLGDWIEADLRDAAVVRHAARGVDVVFHLGAVVGVDRILADPVACIDICVNGTRNALEAAASAEASLIHVSTSEVLGRGGDLLPWDEGAPRELGPPHVDRWSYAAAKATAEHVVLGGAPARAIPATVVRPFNVYGPGQRERFVVPIMVAAALAGEPIPVHGTGAQTRCFTYVSDVVDALVALASAPSAGRLFHIGSDREVSILELAQLVSAAAGIALDVSFVDPSDRWGGRFEDIDRRLPDVAFARRQLGWTATTSLEDGLARTVAWASGATTPTSGR